MIDVLLLGCVQHSCPHLGEIGVLGLLTTGLLRMRISFL